MSKMYVVIKVGTQVPELRTADDHTVVQCEAAFFDKAKAEAFYVAKNSAAKREIVENIVCDIVRVIHEIEVTE
jgi:hypothetical protein